MLMFLLKKIAASLLSPLSLCIELLLLGLFLLWFTRKQRAGKTIVSLGVILLCLFSYCAISNIFLRPLEHEYPPLINPAEVQGIKWVVVLGGGHISDPGIPATSQLSDASLARLVEGVRLYKMLPGSKLVLSGGCVFDPQITQITQIK